MRNITTFSLPVCSAALVPAALILAALTQSCRHDEMVIPSESESVGSGQKSLSLAGMYILNEGNMGSNKCTLDFYDFNNAIYTRNLYAERNPGVVMELGDVGNDIAVYGSRLYIVVNCSNKVEVLNAYSGIRIGQIDIPTCRYLAFEGRNAYVSSYVGPVQIDPSAPLGEVYRVDTLSLAVTGRATVGYQPEEMAVSDGFLYVANSGGYRPPEYDNRVSAIRLSDFTVTGHTAVAANLHRLRRDSHGRIWVTSRGNYSDTPSRIHLLEKDPDATAPGLLRLSATFDTPCTNLAIHGDMLYFFASPDHPGLDSPRYGIIDLTDCSITDRSWITDGTEADISVPYGLAVNPENGDIYITDAKNYVSSGTLHCYSSYGVRRWSVRTGDIPSAITFLPK